MKETIDAIMQIVTLIIGLACTGLAVFNTEKAVEYLAISMVLVSVSLLFSRIQDKEEK